MHVQIATDDDDISAHRRADGSVSARDHQRPLDDRSARQRYGAGVGHHHRVRSGNGLAEDDPGAAGSRAANPKTILTGGWRRREHYGRQCCQYPPHAAASERKFSSMRGPCSVSTLSGWNCTPQIGSAA